jgi:hypothetical protein
MPARDALQWGDGIGKHERNRRTGTSTGGAIDSGQIAA